jgi:hypothetical protein
MAFNAKANRAFLGRAVRFLAGEAGIRQFLDIGTGIPTAGNTHQVAQAVAPEARGASSRGAAAPLRKKPGVRRHAGLSSGHENAEWVASGIGQNQQGLVFVVRPVVQQGRTQVLRSLAMSLQLCVARYAEVMVHLLGHVVCGPRCPGELFHLVEREYSVSGVVDKHKPVGAIGGAVFGWLIARPVPQAEELAVELRELPAVCRV